MSPRRLALLAASGLLLLGALLVVVLVLSRPGGGTGTAAAPSAYLGAVPPGGIALPAFALRDERGLVVRSQSLRGQVVLVTFLSTPCTDACPLIGEIVARAVGRLTPQERSRVAALGISVNPRADTATARRAFLTVHRARGRLRYLSGDNGELVPLWKELGVLAVAVAGSDDVHSAPVRLYDARGIWVDTLSPRADLTVDALVHDLRAALAGSG